VAATVSRKLSNALEGALAGGGDPATSPLYVFGPFLKLIVVAGVADVTFGASVWLVVFTIAMVSAMYRLVMRWVTDGSGGSGLTEEEFGGWAVKINAGITFVEYTLTFLVSMAALVTFIADRVPMLNEKFLFLQYRAIVAVILSILTGWVVNRGPKTAAAIFGPATAAVLLLLWTMNIATIIKLGLHLPNFSLQAFQGEYLHYTLAGYARILAVMTGIEVFANLVAAYEGTPEEKSRKAFGSLLIIMGTAAATMLITGPAIYRLSDPTNPEVSVFTQTMDKLLPAPLAYAGTLIGVAVLLSASAASAQGLQNLALGLKSRHYVPEIIGRRNKYDVADVPVWIEVGIASLCFLFIGTREETYLSVYAAGVFILLSMTGWAASKRLVRELKAEFSISHAATLVGTVIAAFLTTGATIIIFAERFKEGAWTYFIFIPVLYAIFTYYRKKLGPPSPLAEELGRLEEAMWSVVTPGEAPPVTVTMPVVETTWEANPERLARWREPAQPPRHILVPLGGSVYAEQALEAAITLARANGGQITLVSVIRTRDPNPSDEQSRTMLQSMKQQKEAYLQKVAERVREQGVSVDYQVGIGPIADVLNQIAHERNVDLLIMTTHSKSAFQRWLMGSKASKILQLVNVPVLVFRPHRQVETPPPIKFDRILVPLDGSEYAERVLPYARALAAVFHSQIILLSIPEVPEPGLYGTMADVVAKLRAKAEAKSRAYLSAVAEVLREEGHAVEIVITGTDPARTILEVGEQRDVDLIMLSTHGHGALDRVFLGSTAERVVHHTQRPVFMLPIPEHRPER